MIVIRLYKSEGADRQLHSEIYTIMDIMPQESISVINSKSYLPLQALQFREGDASF